MMEALACHPLGEFSYLPPSVVPGNVLTVGATRMTRHHQGAHAAFTARAATRHAQTGFHPHRR
jgi:hypothetical protein